MKLQLADRPFWMERRLSHVGLGIWLSIAVGGLVLFGASLTAYGIPQHWSFFAGIIYVMGLEAFRLHLIEIDPDADGV